MEKNELKNYLRMSTELKRLEEKIKETRHTLEKPKGSVLSHMPRGGEYKDFTDVLNDLVELQEFYNVQAKAIIAEQLRVETAIDALSDPIERAVLGYKYVDGLTWEQICVKIGYEWAQTHRIHAKALKNIKYET